MRTSPEPRNWDAKVREKPGVKWINSTAGRYRQLRGTDFIFFFRKLLGV